MLPRALLGRGNVESSVPPSDLSQIGNDDRNLGMFFVNMNAEAAERVGPNTSIPAAYNQPLSAGVDVYLGWQPSCGFRRAKPPCAGPLAQPDHATSPNRALFGIGRFGARFPAGLSVMPFERLVAVAVSSNSENTPARVVAHISDLRVS